MTYKIKISDGAVRGERVVHLDPLPGDEELPTVRAMRVAEAVGGRYVPLYRGYSMAPSVLMRWKLLYDAGWDAYRRTGYVYGWRAFLPGKRAIPIGRALKKIRTARIAPLAQVEVV